MYELWFYLEERSKRITTRHFYYSYVYLSYASYANEHTQITGPIIDYLLSFKNGYFEK